MKQTNYHAHSGLVAANALPGWRPFVGFGLSARIFVLAVIRRQATVMNVTQGRATRLCYRIGR